MGFPQHENHRLVAAAALTQSGKYDEARSIYDDLMSFRDYRSVLIFRCAQLDFLQGDEASAFQNIEKAISIDDSAHANTLLEAAMFFLCKVGNFEKACELFQASQSVDVALDGTEFYEQVIATVISNGMLDEAHDWATQYALKQPQSSRSKYFLGLSQRHLGLNKKATKSFLESVDLSPDEFDAWFLLALIGLDSNDSGLLQRAISNHQRLRSGEADHAQLLTKVGRYSEALQLLQHHSGAGSDDLQYDLGLCEYSQGYFENALMVFSRLAKEEPGDISVLVMKARCLDYLGKFDESRSALLRIDPVELAWNELAGLFWRNGKFEQAFEFSNQAVLSRPDSTSLIIRSKINLALGAIGQAIKDSQAAIEINRENQNAKISYARVLFSEAAGDHRDSDQASRLLRQVTNVDLLKRDLTYFDFLRCKAAEFAFNADPQNAVVFQEKAMVDPLCCEWRKDQDQQLLMAYRNQLTGTTNG